MADYKISTQHSIVVVGGMNPAIHHPSWYRYNGLISPDEELTALANEADPMFLLPNMAQFSIAFFTVQCQQNRWEIKTTIDDQFDRIGTFAARLFDVLLPHTPVARFGINLHLQYRLPCENVGSRLVELLRRTGIPVGGSQTVNAAFRCSDKRVDHTLNVQIEAAAQPANILRISFNGDFSAPGNEPGTQFELGRMLAQTRQTLREECERTGQEVAQFVAG